MVRIRDGVLEAASVSGREKRPEGPAESRANRPAVEGLVEAKDRQAGMV